MSKKRKSTPQSSTLLDFFGKGPTSVSTRDGKRPRLKSVQPKTIIKHDSLEQIIVIDSDSDSDDVVEVSPIRFPPKPIQTVGHMGSCLKHCKAESPYETSVLNALSAPTCSSLNRREANLEDKGTNITSEPHLNEFPTAEHRFATPLPEPQDCDSRGPSPFGVPTMLMPLEQCQGPVPPVSGPSGLPDCSHGVMDNVSLSPPGDSDDLTIEQALREEGGWDMGDDEMKPVDVDLTEVTAWAGTDEDSQSVDIDLTMEVDDTPTPEEQPVECCPICEKELAGLSHLEIHDHVDGCLNALPNRPTIIVESSSSSATKPLRPLSSLPVPAFSPKEAALLAPTVKKEASDTNIFSTLMSSHKENEAWKEASVVEDRNFRPTKANGGRRKAPFYKVMQGMPIAVDAFRYGTIPNVTAYFLTHAHSDHYTNLSAKWDSGPIYCSQGTANLIIHMLGVDPKWVHPLPMDVATVIPNTGGVEVTLIEANHCPGSCLFLFEGKQTINAGDSAYKSPCVGSAKTFRYLHCGDFRACPRHVLHPAVKGKRIDHVYLDTTYLDPKYCFPPQPQVISACAELAKRLVQGASTKETDPGDTKPRTMAGWFTRVEKGDKGKEKEKASASPDKVLVVVGTYSIGKERIVKAIAKALGTKVYCDSRKAAILRCEADSELDALLTKDPLAGGVHLVPLAVIASDRLKAYMERWKGHYTKAIGFRPTGWTFTAPKGTDMLPSIPTVISRSQSRTFTQANLQPMRNSTSTLQVYGVPYSEHSSFFELTCFALSFDWGRMIATVNVGSEASRGKMAKWVERWEAERKKRSVTKVVDYRSSDYW
ncbi:hypothetical protein C8Q74DRAFT_1249143 [Fomes fomentarius]|nr:hypothetical protein C8Q74DRAFT_1249143 [Fomes fomentarius]